jgi:cell division septation protein DedD
MAHHVDAHYDENEGIFLPPQRTLGFNPQLKINDSLLAQSYVEAYDISYPEALRRIEDEVEELKQHLDNEGYYELNDIGRLTVNDEGNLEFEPCEAGILTPDLYGLSSFEMDQIADITAKVKEQEMAHEASGNSNHQDQAITIKMSWVRNVVAAAAALLAFFFLTPQVDNDEPAVVNMSQLNLPVLTTDSNKKSTAELDEQQVKKVLQHREENVSDTTSAPKAAAATQPEPAAPQAPVARYCIVLASQVSKVNADEFVSKLKKQGYTDARVYLNNKIRPVVCGSFQTADEAYKELHKVHHNKELAEAWMYKFEG